MSEIRTQTNSLRYKAVSKGRASEFPPTQKEVLSDFDDLGSGFVVSEFGEVVAAESEFEEIGFRRRFP